MKSAHRFSILALACLTVACAGLAPTRAIAATESYTGGVGVTGPYDQLFDPSWMVNASATHRLNSFLGLRAATGWIRYARAVSPIQIPEDPPSLLRQQVDFIPLSAGFRFVLPARSSHNDRPFIDVAPVMLWSRWNERFQQRGNDLNGNFIDRDRVSSRSELRLGYEVGAGVALRASQHLRPEFGVHYLAAAAPTASPLPSLYGDNIEGLRQWSAGVSLGWEP